MRLMTNKKYLETKRTKMGHVYGSDIQGSSTGFINLNVNKQGLEDSPEQLPTTPVTAHVYRYSKAVIYSFCNEES